MNTVIQSLLNRKSVRAFTGEEIPEEDVQLILEAAVQAPTARNGTGLSGKRERNRECPEPEI